MKKLQALEYAVLSVLTALLFIYFGFAWWWLFALFLLFDLSAIGYAINPKIGALTYNVGHSLIGPIVLAVIFLFHGQRWELFVALVWAFHIFVDRALGYGLKHSDSFNHTHLGTIGKK